MRKRSSRLIDEVEREALDPNVAISVPLRKLVALGGQAGSAELREWASLELRGYFGSDVPLPDYRQPAATLRIDGGTFNAMITGQLISPRELPDGVKNHIDETVPLNGGVAEIEAMIERAKREKGGDIKLTLPMGQDIVRLMNYEIQQHGERYDRVTAIYWSVSHVTLEGVLDQIRTRLVELVAEMRAAMPDEADVPTSAAADNAVSVVIHGGKPRVSVTAAQATGDGSHSVTAGAASDEASGVWKKVGGFIVGAAIIIGTVVAIAAWQNWNPF
jgi:AbiTii-like protein